MAADKIVVIRKRLDRCIQYACNPAKTTLPERQLVDGINCLPQTALSEMRTTKKRWNKTGGVQGYHIIHSYTPGKITPEQAHTLGVEFARRLLGERYEVIVATHLDHAHLHCHIVFNSVSFVDGRKYQNKFHDYFGDIRETSNAVSRENDLSVITPKSKGKHYAEWNAEKQGKAIKTKKQEHIKKHQQEARTAARKAYIKNTTTRTNKETTEAPRKIASAISRTAKAIVNAIAGITGAGAILILLCAVILAGAIAASPLGILFTDETSETTLMEAIAEINAEYAAELQSHQDGSYTSILTAGRIPSWRDVVAVFACKTAWSADGADVITLDAKRIDRLSKVFWDMTDISSSIETIKHEDTNPEDEADDSYTETILTITTSAKTADDMRTEYNFSKQQNEALDLLLKELEEWGIFLSDLDISDAGALALWERLPENLSNERRMVVQYALSLVGKVNYFWGGKSLVLGWDSRWGTPTTVSAAGSPTTGTTRSYGMDCSGFVDWVFYNASGGNYVIGQGGGCISQHNNCYPISWSEAQPGDLVFYPGDSHIGIAGGWDEYGNIQIIHCASGSLNGVVITGKSGFTSIGRPYYYTG